MFVSSIAVLLICHFGLSRIDEDYAHKNAGYWPKLLDGTAPSKSDDLIGKTVVGLTVCLERRWTSAAGKT